MTNRNAYTWGTTAVDGRPDIPPVKIQGEEYPYKSSWTANNNLPNAVGKPRRSHRGGCHIADRYGLDWGVVYEALAYYHRNPEEMEQIEACHTRAATEAAQQSSVTPHE